MSIEIIGHTEQRESLARLWATSSLPSALLFSGPKGIGKSLVARELAGLIFCDERKTFQNKACGQCHSCNVFNSGNMPDFYILDSGEKDESAIARVRGLLYSLHLRSFSSTYRVVILDQVEKMSLQACNVLLKSLEEPKPNSFFILISSNPSRLPITVRSRCQDWRFNPLSTEEMQELLRNQPELIQHNEASDWSINELITLADGAPANLGKLASELELWEEIKQRLDKTFNGDLASGLEYVTQISKNKDLLPDFLHLARIHARQRMLKSKDSLSALKWSYALANFISAEYLIFERNLNSAYVLNAIIADLFSYPDLDVDYALKHNEHLIAKMVV
ncbi:MAG: AAA family ATPase [SAR324 cluster bacterium]|uniref:AAA family ATPase n=1 Tax=SAR324 cluster bacterium TaxID=2024889 RepID=A0A7X9FSH9_9DELT|nr:AAA family ATPase [SAR324 cluster bacterium]